MIQKFVLFLLLAPISVSANFTDVSTSHPYEPAIGYVHNIGLVDGYSN